MYRQIAEAIGTSDAVIDCCVPDVVLTRLRNMGFNVRRARFYPDEAIAADMMPNEVLLTYDRQFAKSMWPRAILLKRLNDKGYLPYRVNFKPIGRLRKKRVIREHIRQAMAGWFNTW